MTQVVVQLQGKEVLRTPLKGPVMVIGRDPATDIHLDNRALSRKHAQIEKRGAAIWIRDLDSQNGTYVNGERIEAPLPLNSGDIIEVGRYQVYIEGADQAEADTPVLTLTGPEGKHRFAMVGDEIIIGRAPSCDIAIGHKSISRRHVRISIQDNTFFAEDLGSQNGTRINNKRIPGPTPFRAGDKIQISDFTVELGYLDQATSGKQERGNKTMMIDRSELAKAAYVDGDFEKMGGAAGRLTVGRVEGQAGSSPNIAPPPVAPPPPAQPPKYGLDVASDDGPRPNAAMQAAYAPPPVAPPQPPPPRPPPAVQPPPPPAMQQQQQPQPPPAQPPKPQPPRRPPSSTLHIHHADLGEREMALGEVALVAEDGTNDQGSSEHYATQGYLLFVRTGAGVIVSVVGDRRLALVNGQPTLIHKLTDGDVVELGFLKATFRA